MARGDHAWDYVPPVLRAVLVAVVYLTAAELGNALSIQQSFSTFWPPAGLLLTVLALSEPRDWPLLIAAAASANIGSDLFHGRALPVAVGFATANCLEGMLGAWLTRRFVGVPVKLSSRRDVVRVVLGAGLVAPVLGATVGTAVLRAAFPALSLLQTWATWWSGDALGVLVVGSLGLSVAEADRRRRRSQEQPAPGRASALTALLVVMGAVIWWASSSLGPLSGWKFALFLPAVLVATLFGPFGAAAMGLSLTVSAFLGLNARWARMTLVGVAAANEILVLQAYLAVLTVAALYVAAAVEEAKVAADAERVAAEKFRFLLETLPTGVSITDESGAIVETSRRAAEIMGIPASEHEARDIDGSEWCVLDEVGVVKPAEDYASVRALNEDRLVHEQQGLVRPDGSLVWLDVTAAPIPLDGYGVAIAYADITEQVEARENLLESEARLREASDHLEAEVAQRTSELVAANEELRIASEAKSRFLANMSHELRTPLNSIIGFAGVMEQGLSGPLTEEQAKQLGMVSRAGKHLLGLVNDILDLERIELGRAPLQSVVFDVRALADDVVATLMPQARAKGIAVRLTGPSAPIEIVSDRSKVEQVLMNLVDNAVKFTDAGQVTVTCEPDGAGVLLTVSDTGIGIPESETGLVMEDFHQVDRSDGMKPGGTGLGLSICRRLVGMLGGRMDLESAPGEGSTFSVWLPGRAGKTGRYAG